MRTWGDEEIWQGLRNENQRQDAFRALYRQYASLLLRYLKWKCNGDTEIANDLLGLVIRKAYLNLAQRETPVKSLKAWLVTIAVHTAIDELRKRDDEDPLNNTMPLNEELHVTVPGPEVPDLSQMSEARSTAIAAVLDRLDARNRTLIEMSCSADCSRDEIAEATGIPKKQITQYLNRAKEHFRKIAREYPVLAALERSECQGERE